MSKAQFVEKKKAVSFAAAKLKVHFYMETHFSQDTTEGMCFFKRIAFW